MDYMTIKMIHNFALVLWYCELLALPVLFFYHNRYKNDVDFGKKLGEIELFLFNVIGIGSLVVLSISGIWLIMQNFPIMKMKWFYLKILLLVGLIFFFINNRHMISAIQDLSREYSDRFFIIYALIPLFFLVSIGYLATIKPF